MRIKESFLSFFFHRLRFFCAHAHIEKVVHWHLRPVLHVAVDCSHHSSVLRLKKKRERSSAVLFMSGSLVIRTRTLSKATLFFTGVEDPNEIKCKALIIRALCLNPKLRVGSSLQQIRVRDSVTPRKTLWQAVQPLMSDRWQNCCLLFGSAAGNTSHTKFTQGIQAAPVVDRRNSRVSTVDGLFCIHDGHFQDFHGTRRPCFQSPRKKRNFFVSPLQSLRSYWRRHIYPVGAS